MLKLICKYLEFQNSYPPPPLIREAEGEGRRKRDIALAPQGIGTKERSEKGGDGRQGKRERREGREGGRGKRNLSRLFMSGPWQVCISLTFLLCYSL
jgi:hypothetical protein